MGIEKTAVHEAALRLAIVAGEVANYCDHVEHNEAAEIGKIREAGQELRGTGVDLSCAGGLEPRMLYARRLGRIERRNVLFHPSAFDGEGAAQRARTWRELQIVQAEHDRAYHADVVGLKKMEQLRHYALHLAKLAGSTAAVGAGIADEEDWLNRRVPDMLLFGIKLATVTGQKLTDSPIEELEVRASKARGPEAQDTPLEASRT